MNVYEMSKEEWRDMLSVAETNYNKRAKTRYIKGGLIISGALPFLVYGVRLMIEAVRDQEAAKASGIILHSKLME